MLIAQGETVMRRNSDKGRFSCGLAFLILANAIPCVAVGQILEEIIVTAQKREQKIQDVAISITAFSGDEMQQLGMENASEVIEQMPNVTFITAATVPLIDIRGVRIVNDFGDFNEPPVGFYVDQVYLGSPAGQDSQLFDMERVEVLRGPQGTLYGRNTTGGLVHFITRKPSDEFDGYGSFQYGSYNQTIVEGAVGGAVMDHVRARGAFKYERDDGWQSNKFLGTDYAVTDTVSGRVLVEVDLNENATLLTNVHTSFVGDSSTGTGFFGTQDPVTFAPCSAERILNSECVDFNGFRDPSPEPTDVFSDLETLRKDTDLFGVSGTLTWQIGDYELVAITAYEDLDRFIEEDADGASPAPVTQVTFEAQAEQFTQEVRLSREYERWRWVAGGFYFTDERKGFVELPQLVAILGGLTVLPGAVPGAPPIGLVNDIALETDSWALFGQLEYDLTDQFRLTAGVRYTEEEKDLVVTDGIPTFTETQRIETDNVTWRFALDWKPTDDLLSYFSVSRGFKSGAFNTFFVAPGSTEPANEEELTAYEIGLKSTLFGGRARFNVSGFYYDYKKVQSILTIPGAVAGSFTIRLVNAGDADVFGVEAELIANPFDNLDVSLGFGLLDTDIKADSLIDGNVLPAPELNFNGLVRYNIPTQWGNFALQTDFRWFDDQFFDILNLEEIGQSSYGIVNVRLLWNSPDERYFAQFFVENAANQEYSTTRFAPGGGVVNTVWGRPLWAGLKVGLNF